MVLDIRLKVGTDLPKCGKSIYFNNELNGGRGIHLDAGPNN